MQTMEKYLEDKNMKLATDFISKNDDLCAFEVLGFKPDIYDKDVILKRWKSLLRMMHPDKNPHENAQVGYK